MKYIILFITILILSSCGNDTENTKNTVNTINKSNINRQKIERREASARHFSDIGIDNSNVITDPIGEDENEASDLIQSTVSTNNNNGKFDFSDIGSVFKNIFSKGSDNITNINTDDTVIDKNIINDVKKEVKETDEIIKDILKKKKNTIEEDNNIKENEYSNDKINIENKPKIIANPKVIIIKPENEVIDTSIINDNKSVELGKPAVQK